jgi:DNA-directed RNA polymerase specialized sigma24 family protein
MQRLLHLSRDSRLSPRPTVSAASIREATFAQISREYDQLSDRLDAYFRARRCPADELVAETLFRLVVKAAEGTVIVDLSRYAGGIARHVYANWVAMEAAVDGAIEPIMPREMSPPVECLTRCLARLDPQDRELLEAYYLDPPHDRVRLLTESGISANALRLRVFHVKERLRSCMTCCLAALRTT